MACTPAPAPPWGADGLADLRVARGCDTGQHGHRVHDFSVSQLGGCIVGEPNGLVHRLKGDFSCLTFFIGYRDMGEVFSFVTLTDKLDY